MSQSYLHIQLGNEPCLYCTDVRLPQSRHLCLTRLKAGERTEHHPSLLTPLPYPSFKFCLNEKVSPAVAMEGRLDNQPFWRTGGWIGLRNDGSYELCFFFAVNRADSRILKTLWIVDQLSIWIVPVLMFGSWVLNTLGRYVNEFIQINILLSDKAHLSSGMCF